ncbi:hypothetical protein E5671_44240 [Streptomyces sp. BA2]|nr:hypothetical protein [Streptomyces sp. BA2]MWA16102.1 hypothetical protein [Streptomyces sp. BA2]
MSYRSEFAMGALRPFRLFCGLTADALREVHFQDGGRRAGSLDEVQLNDIQHLEFDL